MPILTYDAQIFWGSDSWSVDVEIDATGFRKYQVTGLTADNGLVKIDATSQEDAEQMLTQIHQFIDLRKDNTEMAIDPVTPPAPQQGYLAFVRKYWHTLVAVVALIGTIANTYVTFNLKTGPVKVPDITITFPEGEMKIQPIDAKLDGKKIAKVALKIAISYLKVRAPKTPDTADDELLDFLIALDEGDFIGQLKDARPQIVEILMVTKVHQEQPRLFPKENP